MQKQTTLAKNAVYKGIGLHSGREVSIELMPAEPDSGIVFLRTDLEGNPEIKASAENVTSTVRATTIEDNGAKVFTIEHMMSVLHAMRVDNCRIAISAEEPPVADGSALTFFELVRKAGIVEQEAQRRELVVSRPVRVDKDDSFVVAVPYDGFRISFTSINPHKLIGVQYFDIEVNEDSFYKEIAQARTIAYEKEIEALRSMGLGLGGTIDNVIVYNDEGWINPLHYDDELVRHKILDIIGDLRLAGLVKGHFIAVKSGHALNTAMAKLLLEEFK
ncbi:MAG: UDP-3-O-acyl-N-acetylglucosamine deacetylase [Selenomonadaceae bacterium]|nr:UDP-3-O-acyl-N-acetylglucosamine deacetylase [Selenomonadaceae bacterium]